MTMSYTDISKSLLKLFSSVGIQAVNTDDSFSITYANRVLKIVVKRANGVVNKAYRYVNPGWVISDELLKNNYTTKQQRNKEIYQLHLVGVSQSDLSEIFELSQPMISKIVKNYLK